MSKEIKVNQMAVEANVKAISGVNQYLEETALTLADNRTTVTVNSKAQEVFYITFWWFMRRMTEKTEEKQGDSL